MAYNIACFLSSVRRGSSWCQERLKGNLIPRLETFSFDLKASLHQIEDLAQGAATPDVAERVRSALSTLRPKSAAVPEDDALRLTLELSVEEVATPAPSGSVTPLNPTE